MTSAEPNSRVPVHDRLNPVRRIGYRILPGQAFSYVLHLRPAEWPIMTAHTALGLLLAVGISPAAFGASWTHAVLALALWVVCLNGGTLALNSAFDRDEGDVGFLASPPPVPRHLASFAFALMAAGQLLALWLPAPYTLVYAVCFLLSILYSVPPFRFKATAGVDWLINMWGFGTLTPFAGWAATGRPLEPWAAIVFLAFAPLFAGFYPLTQIYQMAEDRARGDRTLALVLGLDRSLRLAIGASALAFLLFAAAAYLGPARHPLPLLLLPAAAWTAVLLPWYRNRRRYTDAGHQRGMYLALKAWALTDVALLVMLGF